jgi:pSer/pThr/pTyr-binding forkhead associated (FHA) protein
LNGTVSLFSNRVPLLAVGISGKAGREMNCNFQSGMRVVLEIFDGPHRGERILLRTGQTANIGRTEWADFVFPRDGEMSGMHFALECGPSTCQIRDLGSAYGTLVNGRRVNESNVGDGDKVLAGQTCFAISIGDASTSDSPFPLSPLKPSVLSPMTELLPISPGGGMQRPAAAASSSVVNTRGTPAEPATPRVDIAASPHGAYRVVLEMVDGPHGTQRTLLRSRQGTTVGRTKRADIALPLDPLLSSLHFAVRCGEQVCRLRDYGSRNGTYVNGNRMREGLLRNGDEICAGNTRFMVYIEGCAVSNLRETQFEPKQSSAPG